MKRVGWFVLAFGALCLVASASYAADNTNGKWALHFAGKHNPATNDCTFQLAACEHLVVEGPADPGDYDVYVIAADVDAINWSRFAISCDGPIHIIDWQPCCDSETPTAGWPGCDEGIGLKWLTDQPGPYVTMGILTVHISGPSVLSVAPHPGDGSAEWCASSGPCPETNDPAFFGSVGFGRPGYNPCAPGPSGGIEAIVRFDPRTLNLKSEGSYVGCTVELPDGYDTRDIDEMTVMLNGIVPAMPGNPDGGGNKRDFKFDRAQVQALFCSAFDGTSSSALMGGGPPIGHGAQFALHVAGDLYDGTHWAGRDTSRVIHQDECEGISIEFTPPELDFGVVAVGSSDDLVATITNTGDVPAIGTITESSPDFSIISGGGPYLLAPGESFQLVVRFAPMSCGQKSCTINIGYGAELVCTGEAGPLSACEVEPTFLDFGTIALGGFEEIRFRITNTGCGPIHGVITSPCPEFEIVAGTESYSLMAGETHDVYVKFNPTACGFYNCIIETPCGIVECIGAVAGQACELSPSSLDFGTVAMGSYADRTFTLTNTGCDPLNGEIIEFCPDFSIVSGGGPYALNPGDALTVTVRFTPATCGTTSCTVETISPTCTDVVCTGTGGGASCSMPSGYMMFGSVDVGFYQDMDFTFSNTGCATLSGFISETCPDFSIVAGGGSYALPPGTSRTVTVRFQPTSAGTQDCYLEMGNGACSDLLFRGTGVMTSCDVTPTLLWFGSANQGTNVDRSFTITNSGAGTVNGVVEEEVPPCSSYSIVSGAGSYSLGPGASRTVTVRFNPTECDSVTCTIHTGCDDVTCSGVGTGSGCGVSPTSWDYGNVPVGWSVEKGITITNLGCTVLSLDINETCDDFTILSGGGPQSLLPGESHTAWVAFQPTTGGFHSCFLNIGSACTLVLLEGTGTASTAALDVFTAESGAAVKISYWLKSDGMATLQVYDAAGRLVSTLVSDHESAGKHDFIWDRRTNDGRSVNTGIYFIKLRQGGKELVKKAMIVH
jgi:hypothetical protein